MMNRSKLRILAFLAAFFCLPSLSGAASPEGYERLQRVDFAARTITVGGNTYPLAGEVRWFGIGKSRAEDVVPLMSGRNAGIVLKTLDGDVVVTQVWIER